MNLLGLGLTDEQIVQCIQVLDKDGDGEVSLDEFMGLVNDRGSAPAGGIEEKVGNIVRGAIQKTQKDLLHARASGLSANLGGIPTAAPLAIPAQWPLESQAPGGGGPVARGSRPDPAVVVPRAAERRAAPKHIFGHGGQMDLISKQEMKDIHDLKRNFDDWKARPPSPEPPRNFGGEPIAQVLGPMKPPPPPEQAYTPAGCVVQPVSPLPHATHSTLASCTCTCTMSSQKNKNRFGRGGRTPPGGRATRRPRRPR